MDSGYSHYCKPCWKYFECTHPDPEKYFAYCPYCSGRLTLIPKPLHKVDIELCLAECERGYGNIRYEEIK